MKQDGTHNLMRPSDIRHYPIFYIELLYAIVSIVGGSLVFLHTIDINVPGGTSAIWQLAGSNIGILALGAVSIILGLFGLYALFKGGFRWRARVMMGQFLLRLYITIGYVAVFGLFPTTWINIIFLALIAAICYLRVSDEARKYASD